MKTDPSDSTQLEDGGSRSTNEPQTGTPHTNTPEASNKDANPLSVGAVLDELEGKAKAATKGPWRVVRGGMGPSVETTAMTREERRADGSRSTWIADHVHEEADAQYLAAVDPATALALIEVARAAVETLNCPESLVRHVRGPLTAALGRLTGGEGRSASEDDVTKEELAKALNNLLGLWVGNHGTDWNAVDRAYEVLKRGEFPITLYVVNVMERRGAEGRAE